jgi:chemotaxis signal transduction protein
MVSIYRNTIKNPLYNFLMIRLDLVNFALYTNQIEGIAEYSFDVSESPISDLFLGNYSKGEEAIPIMNIRKYLNCKNPYFELTSQARIIFVRDRNANNYVGIGVNAILGFYPNLTPLNIQRSDLDSNPDLECFQIKFKVIVGTKSVPILDLESLIDFSRLINQLKPQA